MSLTPLTAPPTVIVFEYVAAKSHNVTVPLPLPVPVSPPVSVKAPPVEKVMLSALSVTGPP